MLEMDLHIEADNHAAMVKALKQALHRLECGRGRIADDGDSYRLTYEVQVIMEGGERAD